MIVVFGANGRTGREIIREAKLRNIPVRAVAKNDQDTQHLKDLVSVNELYFADADHKESLLPVLKGATGVISCIDARTAGFGSPKYDKYAASNIVHAAHEQGIKRILHLSVMGAYRWSPNALNKQSFHLDLWVRRSKVPWTMLRVSCYLDEVIEAHVAPPDGKKPHPLRASSRYAPVSRRDVARAAMDIMPDLIPSRTWLIGGPEVFTGATLEKRIQGYKKGAGPLTEYGPLPNGDVSVAPESTLIMVGALPNETLEWALDPKKNPLPQEPFWNRENPEHHPSDMKQSPPILATLNQNLRYAMHKLLCEDLQRMGITETDIKLDFSQAVVPPNGEHIIAHKASISPMENVRVLDQNNEEIFSSPFSILYDDLADELQIWWSSNEDEDIPAEIWQRLDLGIRRRLHKHPHWKKSLRVRAFAASQHEKSSSS